MYPDKKTIDHFFRYDEDSGLFVSIVDGGRDERVNEEGYRLITIDGISYLSHRCVWIINFGHDPVLDIDHRDGVRGNNRVSNLRTASKSQNAMNRKKNSRNTSGFKGVSWEKREGKWKAEIRKGKKRVFRKFFDCINEANDAVRKARIEIHGEFARHE